MMMIEYGTLYLLYNIDVLSVKLATYNSGIL